MSITIDFDIQGDQWPENSQDIVKTGILSVLNHANIEMAEASVVFADDDFVQNLKKIVYGRLVEIVKKCCF